MNPRAALVLLGAWVLIDLFLAIAATPRGGPELVLPSTLPGASRPSATVIPTASTTRASGPEGSDQVASGNPSPAVETPHDLDEVTRQGTLWWADETLGPAYLAIPIGPGHRVRVCGPADCIDLVSTDAGKAGTPPATLGPERKSV